ncbi:hypothetical protein WMF20_42375 [Sorangium sp. So ce834]|uniref:hypothetical protein n=1 Tax=Sorangium sp. So ce834 TaxID=3133321 RepID=UPI003F5DFB1D
MNRTRRIGLACLAISLLAGAASCGGGAAPRPVDAATSRAADAAPGFVASSSSGAWDGAASEPGAPAPPPFEAAPAAPSAGFEAPSAGRAEGAARRAPSSQVAPEPIERPGLGTEWGETRVSRISTAPFVRADVERPFAVASLFYNDAEGARAMASASGFRRTSPQSFTLAGGAVAIGLRGDGGGFLSGFVAGETSHVVGEAGQRYSVVLRNLTPNRIECVVSVDGLDVMDGQPAAFDKRGYLVEPHGELEIDGFRQSMDTVAAFRFGSVRGSYANQKHGDTRNVGVIGVALFHERGTAPWTLDDVRRRREANPFPGQFATPPGL